jgi:hypothetical protein
LPFFHFLLHTWENSSPALIEVFLYSECWLLQLSVGGGKTHNQAAAKFTSDI